MLLVEVDEEECPLVPIMCRGPPREICGGYEGWVVRFDASSSGWRAPLSSPPSSIKMIVFTPGLDSHAKIRCVLMLHHPTVGAVAAIVI